ncbi:MAG: stage II sporulation protein R [Clostridia bacterium]|nr:stage II sporulation protein R [Clostridia bacterium]
MKSIVMGAACILVALLLSSFIPTDAEAKIYEDTLRLHILAASDSKEDQKLKLMIRDKLLSEYGEQLSTGKNVDEAINLADGKLEEIETSVEEWIKEAGYSYSAEVTLTEEWYDTREYENFTLPCGIYTSLRVKIDGGEGKNWWCVMYPPLCLSAASEPMPNDDCIIDYTSEELRLIGGGKYNIKFKLLEIFSKAFSKKG